MKQIAIIIPKSTGGVEHVTKRLQDGLEREGFSIKRIILHGENIISVTWNDLKNIPMIRKFDVAIYVGSIPQPSHLFVRDNTKVVLFVHGFVMDEIINYIKSPATSLRAKIVTAYPALL
jgi:hypothetical protein